MSRSVLAKCSVVPPKLMFRVVDYDDDGEAVAAFVGFVVLLPLLVVFGRGGGGRGGVDVGVADVVVVVVIVVVAAVAVVVAGSWFLVVVARQTGSSNNKLQSICLAQMGYCMFVRSNTPTGVSIGPMQTTLPSPD